MFLESVECHGGRGLDLMTLAGSGHGGFFSGMSMSIHPV